jgi:thiol:disulfide interchange protein
MFFFGLAFATPFTLLAIFPSAISKLPKSGGWLNSIKVVFAFILLAFGMKFLSNIDQVYGFNVFSRDIYLAIWMVLFSCWASISSEKSSFHTTVTFLL